MNSFILAAIVISALQFCLYIISRFTKDNSLVDVFWGTGFVLVAIFTFIELGTVTIPSLLFNLMITIWGIRLSIYIGKRKVGKPEDFRYANWRDEWGKTEVWRSFLQIYFLQGFLMFLISLPIIKFNSIGLEKFSWVHYLGISIFLIGFLIEAIADYQKNKFKQSNPDKLMKKGLWKYSRHPNYFGEAVLWWGIAIYTFPSIPIWFGIASATIVTILVRFVSGVPMLEKAKDGNSDFEQYKQETNVFFPWFQKNS